MLAFEVDPGSVDALAGFGRLLFPFWAAFLCLSLDFPVCRPLRQTAGLRIFGLPFGIGSFFFGGDLPVHWYLFFLFFSTFLHVGV